MEAVTHATTASSSHSAQQRRKSIDDALVASLKQSIMSGFKRQEPPSDGQPAISHRSEQVNWVSALEVAFHECVEAVECAIQREDKQKAAPSTAVLQRDDLARQVVDGFAAVRDLIQKLVDKLNASECSEPQENAYSALLLISQVVDALKAAVRTVYEALRQVRPSSSPPLLRMSALNNDVEKLYVVSHHKWMVDFSSQFVEVVVSEWKSWPWRDSAEFRMLMPHTWDETHVEGTTVRFPHRCSDAVASALFALRQRLEGLMPLTLRVSAVRVFYSMIMESMSSSALDLLTSILQKENGDGPSVVEDALMQLYFDISFIARALSLEYDTNSHAAAVSTCFRVLEGQMDVVNWSIAKPVIDAAVKSAVLAAALVSLCSRCGVVASPSVGL